MNDKQDIDAIYKAHVNDLFSYAISLGFDRETSMDAIHDVFYKICLEKKTLDAVVNMRFFLLKILKNRLLDIYKQKKEITGLSLEALAENMPFTIWVTVENEFIKDEEQAAIHQKVEQLLKMLTARQREIIFLRYSQGCGYEEIAKLMHITAPACRKLLHKAISKLKK